jgi:preprotein translocase subunit SecG
MFEMLLSIAIVFTALAIVCGVLVQQLRKGEK